MLGSRFREAVGHELDRSGLAGEADLAGAAAIVDDDASELLAGGHDWRAEKCLATAPRAIIGSGATYPQVYVCWPRPPNCDAASVR